MIGLHAATADAVAENHELAGKQQASSQRWRPISVPAPPTPGPSASRTRHCALSSTTNARWSPQSPRAHGAGRRAGRRDGRLHDRVVRADGCGEEQPARGALRGRRRVDLPRGQRLDYRRAAGDLGELPGDRHPGRPGLGRATERRELEERARAALVRADIVLLCFDTQHQQAAEFRKVAEWIAEFGERRSQSERAVPDLLFPTRVPRSAVRWRFSRPLRNTPTRPRELAAIGIHEIPPVALHTQRAVYARATEPIQVPAPQARSLRRLRAEVGPATLLDWSTCPCWSSCWWRPSSRGRASWTWHARAAVGRQAGAGGAST